MEISEANKQREQKIRGWFGASESLFSCTVTKSEVPWFQSPRAMFCHWVASRCSVGRRSAFLSNNELEDSDNVLRLKPGMAETSLIHFAKTTAENSSTLWLEIVIGNSNFRKLKNGNQKGRSLLKLLYPDWKDIMIFFSTELTRWECRKLLIILAKLYLYYILINWSMDTGIQFLEKAYLLF